MSVTYTEDRARPYGEPIDSRTEAPYVPVYARGRVKSSTRGPKGKVKTWMILAPIGVLVIGGSAALMMMQPATTSETALTPAVEPAPIAPPPSPAVETVPVMPPVAPAPVVREAAPAPAPAVRSTPARRAAPPAAERAEPVARVEAPAVNPQPLSSSTTSTLNTTPAAPPATPAQPAAPEIVVQPLG